MTALKTTGAPWHFWGVAIVMVLWNGLAAFDYILSVIQGAAYYRASGMTEAQVTYFSTLPLWASAAWSVSVWSSVVGGLLFVFRRRLSAALLAVSVTGTLGYIAYTYVLSDGRSFMGAMWPMPGIVAVTMVCLIAYIGALGRKGIMR